MDRLSPPGKSEWSTSTIRSILSNEKYKGDAIINKTFTVDCLTKEVRKNRGERPKYYVENSHPAIIDAEMFGRVQEELARRIGKKKVKEIGTKTEQGKYSSKYALTDTHLRGVSYAIQTVYLDGSRKKTNSVALRKTIGLW